MSDIHPRLLSLLHEKSLYDSFVNNECVFIKFAKFQSEQPNDFDAIGVADDGTFVIFNEIDVSLDPPDDAVFMKSDKWKFLKDRKSLFVSIHGKQLYGDTYEV
jgi:hypothetical protein